MVDGKIIAASVIVTLIVLGMVGFEIAILVTSQQYTSASESCPPLPNLTTYHVQQDLWSLWHYHYNYREASAFIENLCTSPNGDVGIYVDGKLAARSDIKLVSFLNEASIKDCHGSTIFLARTGDAWEAMINKNKVWVSFELRDATDSVLAYVDGTHFFGDEMNIYAPDSTQIAHITRNIFDYPPLWNVEIYQPAHPAADFRVIGYMIGTRSVPGKKGKKDTCASMFWGIAWTFLAIGVILVLGSMYLGYKVFREGKEALPCYQTKVETYD